MEGQRPEVGSGGSRETCEQVVATARPVDGEQRHAEATQQSWQRAPRGCESPLWSLETRAFLPAGPQGLQALDIVHPVRVDAGGAFLSYDLRPRTLRKRAVSAHRAVHTFYELQFRGRPLRFHLAANTHLLAPGFVSETRRTGGLGRTHIRTRWHACHLLGKVQDPELEGGMAAISACDGLVSARSCLGLTWWLWPFTSPKTQSPCP